MPPILSACCKISDVKATCYEITPPSDGVPDIKPAVRASVWAEVAPAAALNLTNLDI